MRALSAATACKDDSVGGVGVRLAPLNRYSQRLALRPEKSAKLVSYVPLAPFVGAFPLN